MEDAARRARRYCCIPTVHNELWNFEKVTVSGPPSAAGIIFLESPNIGTAVLREYELKKKKRMEKYFFLRAIENREMHFYCVSMENLYTSQICNLYRISQDLLSFMSRMLTRKTEISSDGEKYRIFIWLVTTPYSIYLIFGIYSRDNGKWHLTSSFAENGWILDSRRV